MKVAVLSTANSKEFNIGGKHVHQNLLERALRKLECEVTTYYPPFEKSKWLRALKLLLANPLNISYTYRLKHKTRKEIAFFSSLRLNNFDVVHCHDVISLYPINHPRVVLTVHGYLAREAVNNMKKTSEKSKKEVYNFCLNIEKEALPKAKHVIAVDTRIKNYLVQELGYPEENITVIYNAVDTDLFCPVSDEEKLLLRKELRFPEEAFIVLVPRRYVKKNGVDYAAKAFTQLKSSDYFFVFVGGGPMKGELKKILSGNKNALVLDGIPNDLVHKYYKAADVILIPSVTSDNIEEATSLSMLEGMACGKVTICTNVGGMKEVIRNMENGILIEQKDPDAIVEALEYAKKNYSELEGLRKRAREYVLANHSYLEHAKKVIRIYERVLDLF